MDKYKNIEQLLEKYWVGETSVEEEKELRTFFVHTRLLPPHLQQYAELFIFQHEQAKVKLPDDFDQKLLKKLGAIGTNRLSFRRVPLFFKVAASIIIVLGAGFFTYRSVEKKQAQLLARAEARETVIDALSILSEDFRQSEAALDQLLQQLEPLQNINQ